MSFAPCRPHKHAKGTQDLCAACNKHESAEKRIQELSTLLAQAEAERVRIRVAMNEIHDPLHKLPHELVSRIFECIYTSKDDLYGKQTPLGLGAVCHRWRAIAWSTPALWSYVSFCINPPELEGALPVRLSLLWDYIERSRALPLSIEIFADDQFKLSEEEEDIEDLIEILNACSGRWISLDLQLPARAFPYLAKKPRPYHLNRRPILKSLSVSLVEEVRLQTADYLSFDYRSMTLNLESLNMTEELFDLDSFNICPARLKYVTAFGSMNAWLSLLSEAPLLECATLSGKRVRGRHTKAFAPAGVISRTSLKTLDITPDTASLEALFTHFTCPNLHSLSIDSWSPRSTGEFRQFLGNESRALKTLDLRRANCHSEALGDFLVALTSLENLTFSDPRIMSATTLLKLIFQIRPEESGTTAETHQETKPLLPNLKTVEYIGMWSDHDDWSFLQTIQEFHWPGPNSRQPTSSRSEIPDQRQSNLQKLEFTLHSHYDLVLMQDFMFLQPDDLDIVIKLRNSGVKFSARSFGDGDYVRDLVERSAEEIRCAHAKAAWDDIFKKRPEVTPIVAA